MSVAEKQKASPLMIIIAFAVLYIVWGSTYFFIAQAVAYIPPFILGAFRFLVAGGLLLGWCAFKKENLFNREQIKHAAITGVLLLFIGNGAVIWVEKVLPSSLVGVLIASQAIWLVLWDKDNWRSNFTSRNTVLGLLTGFAGVVLLFIESADGMVAHAGTTALIVSFIVLFVGMQSWSAGSIYSKKHSIGSSTVNSAWQMLAAGIVFIPASFIKNEWSAFSWSAVPASSWFAAVYLIVMGSLAGYSAYVWLLSVRPVAQVSTHVYVNPVVAVLLGVLFAGEPMSWLQIGGLAIILTSVLLINLSKYRQSKPGGGDASAGKGKLSMPGRGKQAVLSK